MATREEMKREAIARMELMKIKPDIIRKFEGQDIVWSSVNGPDVLDTALRQKIKDRIKWFENEFGGLVYHVVITGSLFATFLYVSKWDEEWEEDREIITDDNCTVAYVYNMMNPILSELGGVQFKCEDGIVIRTA